MARRVASKSQFAKIAGVSKPSISTACQRIFPKALIGDGVDVDHADVQRYLAGKPGALARLAEFFALGGSAPTASRRPPPPPTNSPAQRAAERRYAAPPPQSQRVDVEALLDLTLREIITQYESVAGLGQILDSVRKAVDIRERELKIAERTGRLISRELVRAIVFGPLEELFRRLFTDFVSTAARRGHALAASGGATEAHEQLLRDLLTKTIRPAKQALAKSLRTFEDDEQAGQVTSLQASNAAVELDEHAPP